MLPNTTAESQACVTTPARHVRCRQLQLKKTAVNRSKQQHSANIGAAQSCIFCFAHVAFALGEGPERESSDLAQRVTPHSQLTTLVQARQQARKHKPNLRNLRPAKHSESFAGLSCCTCTERVSIRPHVEGINFCIGRLGIRVKGKKSMYLLQRTVAFIVRHVSGLEGGWKGWRRTFEAVTVR